MANTFNKYYLNEEGLKALIAKIKANDEKLAALMGLSLDTDITAEGFKPLVERIAAIEESAATGIQEALDAIEALKGILDYDSASWPKDDQSNPKPLSEVLSDITDNFASVNSDIEDINGRLDNVEDAFNDLTFIQNDDDQVITIEFKRADGSSKPTDTIRIDTTNFIVHGILSKASQITLTSQNVMLYDVDEDGDSEICYKNGDDYIQLPKNVLCDLANLDPDSDITGISIDDIQRNLPANYLLLTFGTHPSPDDPSIHDQETPVWVNVNNMVKQYDFTNADDDLIGVAKSESAGTTLVTITSTDKLRAAFAKLEILIDGLTDEETGELVDFSQFATHPIGSNNIDAIWEDPDAPWPPENNP